MSLIHSRQHGSAMLEFAVVGPVLTLLGLAVLQYALLFVAKNSFNHAAFMAARAGTTANASLASAQRAYISALVPLYGGGRDAKELAESQAKAAEDIAGNARFELLNPTRQSFDDWNDPALQEAVGKGRRVIPNSNLALKNPRDIGSNSGQNIQDANLIKLRITQGYEPKVPLVGLIYAKYLRWLDPHTDEFQTRMIEAGRIPVVTHVVMQMQSDAIEPQSPVSIPGPGNNGVPSDPGDPPTVSSPPPDCLTIGCTVGNTAPTSAQASEEPCPGTTTRQELRTDALFDFGSSQLSGNGQAVFDRLIDSAKAQSFASATVTGYTDQLGSEALNNKLSLDRATAVRAYLQSHGFPDKPINVQGLGSQDPQVSLSSCPSSGQAQIDCLAPNRRVVVTINGLQ